jgi:glucokinase
MEILEGMTPLTTSEHARRDDIVVGIDIGGTKTALIVWDRHAETILVEDAVTTPTELGPNEFVEGLAQEITALIARADRTQDDLVAIGVAVPGLVDAAAGKVIEAGNLAGWIDFPLRDCLQGHFPVAIGIEHDANAAALGEQWRGAAQGERDFVFLALGTGIGAGIMMNGQLYRGAHHASGEVGNFVMSREFLGEERDGQGNLAHLIGGRTLRARAEDAIGEEISAAEAITTSTENQNLAEVADDVIDYLAITVIAIASLLDPPLIVLGGGTAAAGYDLITPVRERVALELAREPRIIPARLGSEAQLYGAIFSAIACSKEGAGFATSAL